MLLRAWLLLLLALYHVSARKKGKENIGKQNMNEKELEAFLEGDYERNASAMCRDEQISAWNYSNDLNDKRKEEISTQASIRGAKVSAYYYKAYFKGLSRNNFKTEKMRRLAKFVTNLDDAGLSENKYERLINVVNQMTAIYGKAKVCPYKKQKCNLNKEGLSQNPDIEESMRTSKNVSELVYLWTAWTDATGKKMRNLYQQYVDLKNEASKLNGFKDCGENWRDRFDTENFEKVVDKLWKQLEPFYDNLHFYVRTKLKKYYGKGIDVSDGLLPAYITGNLYAQDWSSLLPIVVPFPNVGSLDLTTALKAKNYTVLKMFQTANDFYKSMGMPDSSMSFGKKARIVKPKKAAVCHASAWDFCDRKDFRICMCTKVNEINFLTIHHELGHIHYYMQYKNHQINFRNAPNPGFHEAIGDSIVLSVMNPVHLKKIGLIDSYDDSKEAEINSLMAMALKLIAFLPFGLILDKWRWDIFSGKYKPDQWNDRWWYYRKTVQKLKPPNKRSKHDLDAGAKFHVPADSQYMAYFIAHVVQFQLHRGMCKAAGLARNKQPLHKCDIYKSKEAGSKLMAGLKLGSSVHWSVALKKMTGESELTTSAILDYFDPLIKFLQGYKTSKSKNKKG